jgi:predicted HicB family RNase H-like nuclease
MRRGTTRLKPRGPEALVTLNTRITTDLDERLRAYALESGRSLREIVESGIVRELDAVERMK